MDISLWNVSVQRKSYALALLVIAVLTVLVAVGLAVPYFLGRRNDIIIEISTDKPVYRVNEVIQIFLKIINPTNSTIVLHFSSSHHAEYEIIQNRNVVYYGSDGVALEILTQITIPAHEMVIVQDFQHKPQDYFLKSGVYMIHGLLAPLMDAPNKHYGDSTFIVVSS